MGYLLSPNSEQTLDLADYPEQPSKTFVSQKYVKSVSVKKHICLFFFSYQNRGDLNQLPLKLKCEQKNKKGSGGIDSSSFAITKTTIKC